MEWVLIGVVLGFQVIWWVHASALTRRIDTLQAEVRALHLRGRYKAQAPYPPVPQREWWE
jgi:hypothetical protein